MATKISTAIIAVILALTLCGCSQKKEIQYIEKPIYVQVPVIQEIEIEPIKKPRFKLLDVKESSSSKEVAEAYATTVKQMNIYIKKLESVVVPFYKKESSTNGKSR